MKRVTHIRYRVRREGLELTAIGQSARGTKFGMRSVVVKSPEGGFKKHPESLTAAIETLLGPTE